MTRKKFQNIHQMLKQTVDKSPDESAFRWFTDSDAVVSITWRDFYNQVKNVSQSLMALGVQKDDKVNILSNTCFRWALADMGIVSVGAVTVGIYQSNLAKDCKYIIEHCDSVLIFAENETQLKKLIEIRKDIPKVKKVILFNGSPSDNDWVMSFEDFLSLGKDISDDQFQTAVNAVKSDDPAGIVYTSGTTGLPKGAVLTHDNVIFTAETVSKCGEFRQGDEMFLFLPLAHVFARTCLYTAIFIGNCTTFSRGMDTLVNDFKLARPHWFVSVPRIFEKIYAKIISGAESKGGAALKIFRWACNIGDQVSDCKLAKKPIPMLLNLQYKLATKLVFGKVLAALGGRVRWCISGAAPINPSIAKFFHAAGLLILEGIGMTEDMSFSHVNRLDNYRFGWVGQPGPDIEHKAAEDGEILIRGRNVMTGYYKMPDETKKTFTDDGWLLTGDVGEIDAEDFLKITGRKKELIITSGGKNIAPSHIEGILGTSKYISQACVIGERRNYLTAIVTLNMENVREYAEQNSIAFNDPNDLISEEKIIRLIEAQVAEKNKSLPSYESIKKIRIVPEFTIDNGMITPTMKLKKNVVFRQYAQEIEAMYSQK